MAEKDKKVTVVSAAMKEALGLSDFFKTYPERAFDVGICEENAAVLCASMAAGGLKPYYAIYSTFLQRAFDEIIHDVCAQDMAVTFCMQKNEYYNRTHGKDRHTVTITYKLGITNLEFTVGLTENLTPAGAKVNDWLIPRTLRINDKAIDTATDADFVDFIFSKKATEAQYDTVCYAASDAALPDCVKPLLTENLLSQFTMDTETLQPV